MFLSSIWCAPLSGFTLWILSKGSEARIPRFFTRRGTLWCMVLCGVVGLLSGVAGLAGAWMAQEYLVCLSTVFLIVACYVFIAYGSLLLLVLQELGEEKTVRFYRIAPQRGDSFCHPGRVGRAVGYTCLLLLMFVFLAVNGATGYRLMSRGVITRYYRPPSNVMVPTPSGHFHLECMGEGPLHESDVFLLLDADIAASSLGYSWLVWSLSQYWRTCWFDRPGYGWSDSNPPPRSALRETEDLSYALGQAGLQGNRFVYISHGLSSWNALLFKSVQPRVVAMVFLDPLDPRDMMRDSEASRYHFIDWAPWAMIGNSFGLLSPFFEVIQYFHPVWQLPQSKITLYIDAVSKQSFWSTLVDETNAAAQSAQEVLSAYPYGVYALGNLPIAMWARPDSSSLDYYSTLSTDCRIYNLTGGHWFLFQKLYAVEIVNGTTAIVLDALLETRSEGVRRGLQQFIH